MFCFAKQKLLITSDNNEYPVTALSRASTQIRFRFATANFGYSDTLYKTPLPAKGGGAPFYIMSVLISTVTLRRASHNSAYLKYLPKTSFCDILQIKHGH